MMQGDPISFPAPDPARPYVYPGTRVLINLFGIDDMVVLERVVASVAGLRGEQIDQGPLPGNFELSHLCAIHRHLFQDVFA